MSKKVKGDITGFEEFIEHQEAKKKRLPKKSIKDPNFKILNLLENDTKRLKLALELYSEKINLLEEHPQDIDLIVKQEGENMSNRNYILERILTKNSGYERQLAEIFNTYFN